MSFVILHRVLFDLGYGTCVEIESSETVRQIKAVSLASPGFVSADAVADEVISSEIPKMCWREGWNLFEPFQLREDAEYFIDITLPISLSEAISRSVLHTAWPLNQRLSSAFVREPCKRWREIEKNGKKYTIITGQIKIRSYVGVIEIGTEFGGALRAEVVSRKLKYFQEFKSLIEDLAKKSTELLMAYETPISLSFNFADKYSDNESSLHFSMRYLMSPSQLPSAISEIIHSPHSKLLEHPEPKEFYDLDDIDAELILENMDGSSLGYGGPLARFFDGYTPEYLIQNQTTVSFDTLENRYAKAFLEHCGMLSQKIELRMLGRNKKGAAREAASWWSQINEMLQSDLWKQVGSLGHIPSNSQVMHKKRGYKELFRLDIALRMSLSVAWPHGAAMFDGLSGDARPVSKIYEYWCFFILYEVIRSLCREISGGNFLSVSSDSLQVRLKKGIKSECKFLYKGSSGIGLQVSLFYNRQFTRLQVAKEDWSGSYTAAFDPDYSVMIRSPKGAVHWLHFDAKYKLEKRHVESMFSAEPEAEEHELTELGYNREISRVHKQDDLFKMHTYRDGIFSTRGAYVLFPGDGVGGRLQNPGKNLFVRHPSAVTETPKYSIPSVGVFPLTPENSGQQIDAIRNLISCTLEGVSSQTDYAEEVGWFSN
ncbi:DUF2357 domain-containing protein [Ectothiorhodospira variabilis]|uniref:DUF2357 domain-containing protein n=1 Tax=Ectothiorhodospira variabilis TaxID=505694 RepID=UPI001EFB7795|nr:DUF2357 domain-containing protein [Ectothiorhodospira variabilis]MCG5496012.1 restriction endonuclease-like protein [Ectothiorhodospira variabilis]MCG5504171.1 restriction endonuclease-like protein [Ectothiorhodospira variabilis]MCG5507326.1 restriction endonuclease-like protein [Ectothiorhodospira variabilis]